MNRRAVAAACHSLDEDGKNRGLLLERDLRRPDGGEGRTAEERDPDPFDLRVLIDQHSERGAVAQGAEQLARCPFPAALDGCGAEPGAEAGEHLLEPRL